MTKLLLAVAAIFTFSFPAFSQTPSQKQQENLYKKPVLCYPSQDLIAVITEKFNEELAFLVSHEYSDETLVALFVNLDKGTYTLIEFNADSACVLASGTGFKLLPLKPAGLQI